MASETIAFLRFLFCFPSPMFCAHHQFLVKALLLLLLLMVLMLNMFLLQMHQDYGLLQSEEKEEGFLPAMTRLAASAHPSPLLITFTNGAQSNFVKSFLCNLNEVGGASLESRLVTVVSDRQTQSNLTSFSSRATLVLRPFIGANGNLRFASDKYIDFIEYRTQAILELLQANISLLLVDADHYWAKNPLPWLESQAGFDIMTENAHFDPYRSVCGGFLFLNNTPATLQLWEKVTQQTKFFRSFPVTSKVNEQDVLSSILPRIRDNRTDWGTSWKENLFSTADWLYPPPSSIRWKFLPNDKFAPGRWYFDEHKKEREREVWSIHNNWVVGNNVKIGRAKKFGHWFYNERVDSCITRQHDS